MPSLPRKMRLSESAFAVQWNAMVDYLASLRPIEGPGTFTSHTPFGTARSAATRRGGSIGVQKPDVVVEIALFKLDAYGDPYVTAFKSDGTGMLDGSGGWAVATTNVYKQYLLTHIASRVLPGPITVNYSAYSSANQTRTYSVSGGSSGDETIIPKYCQGDVIIAALIDDYWCEISPFRYWASVTVP